MSATLVIECSTPQASVAVVNGKHVVQHEFTSDRNHNAMLFEPLQELLNGHGDIERILVGSGPGSYSGTRVGIAAAQGIGLALGCPPIAVPSILAVPAAKDGQACLAIGDARRGSYWTSIIQHQIAQQPQLCNVDELTATVSKSIGMPIFAFEEAARFPIGNLQSEITIQVPNASRLWQAWSYSSKEQQLAWQAEVAQPIYLKPPHITPSKRKPLI